MSEKEDVRRLRASALEATFQGQIRRRVQALGPVELLELAEYLSKHMNCVLDAQDTRRPLGAVGWCIRLPPVGR